WGYAPPMILAAGVSLKLFDVLDSGPKTLAEVVSASGASERGVRMILNALAGFKFVNKSADGRFSNAPDSSAFLVSTKPSFMGGFVDFSAWNLIPLWNDLREVVRTGAPSMAVNQQDHGEEFFQGLVEPIFNMSYPATQFAAKALNIAEAKQP